jgi:dihydroorotase
MVDLAEAGAVGLSDDGHPVADANIMRQALSYSSSLGLPIINHCEVPELSSAGAMNEGWTANRLGLRGIPNASEEAMVARDIALVETVGGRLHIAHASTAGTVELVRQAKSRGAAVTCEVTPHHLTLTDEAILGCGGAHGAFKPLTDAAYDTNAKVAPPLRSRDDREAMAEGLRDGTVDFVATDHAPHGRTDKLCTFDEAANGISVLETALGSLMSLVHENRISLSTLVDRLTVGPARVLGPSFEQYATLEAGSPADLVLFDPNLVWTVDTSQFASKGRNTPLEGVDLKGRVVATMVEGRLVYQDFGV